MNSLLLKSRAKEKLSGVYLKTVLGMLVCYIPEYILSQTIVLLTVSMLKSQSIGAAVIPILITAVVSIFVTDIFGVGFFRSLVELNDCQGEKTYNINLVLSGFGKNYINILKSTFLRRLYMFGWFGLMMLPMILAVGIIAFLSATPAVSGLISLIGQAAQSPTPTMAENIVNYIAENCIYVTYIIGGASILSTVLLIPAIRKSYEYQAIPMILAEHPDLKPDDVFKTTKEIMCGYRMKYFLVELSFIGILILIQIAAALVPNTIITYILMALAVPYMQMTFLQFYFWRTRRNEADVIAVVINNE